jgi:integration host factor subunit alpha
MSTAGLFHPCLWRPVRYIPSSPRKLSLNLPGFTGFHAPFEEYSMTLTKAHIVDALFAQDIFTKDRVSPDYRPIFELIKKSMQDGEDVLISGFGKFSVKEKYERNGRNPETGEPITLPARRVVTFKCSGVLRAAMNGEVD